MRMKMWRLALFFLAMSPVTWVGAQAGSNPVRKAIEAAEFRVLERAVGPKKAAAAKAAAAALKSRKIVGGTPASRREWRWQVALLSASEADNFFAQFCGGTLIRADWVLTAAHCIEIGDLEAADIHVLTGTRKLNGTGVRRPVVEVVVHPSYDGTTFDYDVALLRLGTIPDERLVKPVTPKNEAKFAPVGATAWVTGWGTMTHGQQDLPISLMEVDVPIVSNETCNGPDSYNGLITERMLCTGHAEGGKAACQGDSGGPVVTSVERTNGRPNWRLVGVVSWGSVCAAPNFYEVNARVSVLYDWIMTTIDTAPLSD